MADTPEFAGHLSRGSDGAYAGLLTDGKGLPIHLTAEVCDGPSGRYFQLIGTRQKKQAERIAPPWEESSGAENLTKPNSSGASTSSMLTNANILEGADSGNNLRKPHISEASPKAKRGKRYD